MDTKRRYRRIAIAVIGMLLASPLAFAGGSQETITTKIDMANAPRQFIAPGNPDAANRQLVLPFSKITIPGTNRVIKSWTFTVYNASGDIVSEDSRLETRSRGFFAELFNIGEKPQVEIPKDLNWDGTYKIPNGANNGQLVPDGSYTYQLTITDDAKNRAQTPPFNVTVKNAPVTIDYIRIPNTVFSPIGKRNSVSIEQSGSKESHWEGQIINSDHKVVRSYVWENPGDQQLNDLRPLDFAWDGKNDAGTVLPEGTYSYKLIGKNRAGATKEQRFEAPIYLSLKSAAAQLSSDTPYFSPNGDGILDTITFSGTVSETGGIQQSSLVISDLANNSIIRWSRTNSGELPKLITFDGMDSGGKRLADGKYQAVLSVTYDNGNVVTSLPAMFEVDLSPPKASLAMNNPVFGGKDKPGSTITLKGSAGDTWRLDISDKDGKVVSTIPVSTPDNFSYEFKGLDNKGTLLPDDLYTISANGSDKAGNKNTVAIHIRKDTRDMKTAIVLSQPVLVPNRGKYGIVRISPVLSVFDNLEKLQVSVTSAAGTQVANHAATSIFGFWDWNGKDEKGRTAADGDYMVYVSASYANGTVAKAQVPLRVDSHAPEIKLSLKSSTPAFIPIRSNLTLLMSASPADFVKTWQLSLVHNDEGDSKVFIGVGPIPASLDWNGRTDKGQIVDGNYAATLAVVFENGMTGDITMEKPIIVSSSGPKVELSLSNHSFVPGNIDGPESVTINIKPEDPNVPISAWSLVVNDERNKPFRTWKGSGTPPASLVWDGKGDKGEIVESGEDYQVNLSVSDAMNLETRKSDKLTIDIQVVKTGATSYKIVISSIQFAGNSSDIFRVEPKLLDKNLFVLQRLAVVLNKFPNHKIRLEGYAVSEYWDDPKQADWEQKTQLIPLSTNRAEEVKSALMLLKVDGNRFAVQGFGAERPLVPNGDLENRWKNRRVEFYLDKK